MESIENNRNMYANSQQLLLRYLPIIDVKPIMVCMVKIMKSKKQILYDGLHLFLKTNGEIPQKLGTVNTRNGNITRVDKLKAVQFKGEWVEL
jgi:hypothetical protein